MMRLDDIFNTTDMGGPRTWLRTVLLPMLVDPAYLERQGFNPAFIERFNRKHDRVLYFNGTIARGPRGVNELELLRGLAEALDVRPFKDGWNPRDIATTTKVARQCLDALAAMEEAQKATSVTVQRPEGAGEAAASAAEVRA